MLTVTITSKDKAWTRIGFEKESIQIQNIKKPYNTRHNCVGEYICTLINKCIFLRKRNHIVM